MYPVPRATQPRVQQLERSAQVASGSAMLWRGRVPPDLQDTEPPAPSATPDEWRAAMRPATGGAAPQAMLAHAAPERLRYQDAESGATMEPWCGWTPAPAQLPASVVSGS